jgi:putative FmdB family regulatory protein
MGMPFYEYECPNCGFRDEVLQKITDKPLKKCPSCGKSSLRKLMSAPVFRLKGSGWYETDFKSDKDKQRNLAGLEKEEAKSETKTEAKPDAKVEAKTDAKTEAKTEATKSDAPAAPAAKPVEKASKSARKAATRSKPKAKARNTRR